MADDAQDSASRDDQLLVLAFYVVIDVSYSMQDEDAIGQANNILPEVIDAIDQNHALGDLVRLGVVTFSDEAQVVLPLGDLRAVEHIPQLSIQGGTSYAAAFRMLRKVIETDVMQLKGDSYKVYRPAVFFITDGGPTDDTSELQAAFAELTDPGFRARPNIIPFGVGRATKEAVEPWVFPAGRMRCYVARNDVKAGDAIAKAAEILLGSILASANSVSESGEEGGLQLPDDDEDDGVWM